MLDKLKLFNREKDRSKSSKRTSSSSGFSSTRSDSSLSLNNDATSSRINKKNDSSNKAGVSSSLSSTVSTQKSSKLLTSVKRTTETSGIPSAIKLQSKNDNKEKSFAKNTADENVSRLLKAPTVKFVPLIQKNYQNDLKVRQQQQIRNNETRIDKTGTNQHQLVQEQQSKQALIQPVAASILKPMAAIKGTSKSIQSEIKRDDRNFEEIKTNKQQLTNSSVSLNSDHQRTQIVNPQSMSPIHNHLLLHIKHKSNSLSMSDSINSTTSNNHSNSSDSSVIYRPSASESGGSELNRSNNSNTMPCQQRDNLSDSMFVNGHKFNTIPTKLNGSKIGNKNNHMATAMYENGQQQGSSSVVPLRSIMQNYINNKSNNHCLTLPTRGIRGGQNIVNCYSDENNQGYCSDGDALRKNPVRCVDIENGYYSEGGGSNGIPSSHLLSIFSNRPKLPMTIAEER